MEILKQRIEDVPDKKEIAKHGADSPRDNVYFDAEKKQMVATNEKIIVFVPVETDKEDITQMIPPDAIKHAKKEKPQKGLRKRLLSIAKGFLVLATGHKFPLWETDDDWPHKPKLNFEKFDKPRPKRAPDACLDVTELKKLTDALFESKTQPQRVDLYLHKIKGTDVFKGPYETTNVQVFPAKPCLKENDGRGLGLLMGCHVDLNKYKKDTQAYAERMQDGQS